MKNELNGDGSALSRALNVLHCFEGGNIELTAKEMMVLTGLPKPTLFRMLSTLGSYNLLRYDEASSRYSLGAGLAKLGAAVLTQVGIRQLAFAPMQTLADRIKGQVLLARGERSDLIFVELSQAAVCQSYRPPMGSHISLTRTATGRAYLLSLPAAQAQAHVRHAAKGDQAVEKTILKRMDQARKDVVKHGFVINRGDLDRTYEAVAVAVHSPRVDEVYVFSANVQKFELVENQLVNDIGPRLVTLAHGFEVALGRTTLAQQHKV